MVELVIRPIYKAAVKVTEPGRTYEVTAVYEMPNSDQVKEIADGKSQDVAPWVLGIEGFTVNGEAIPMEQGKQALQNIYVRRAVSHSFNDILSGKERAEEKNSEPSQDGATV